MGCISEAERKPRILRLSLKNPSNATIKSHFSSLYSSC
jgi:hypothetical protein